MRTQNTVTVNFGGLLLVAVLFCFYLGIGLYWPWAVVAGFFTVPALVALISLLIAILDALDKLWRHTPIGRTRRAQRIARRRAAARARRGF